MEEDSKDDHLGTVVRPPSIRVSGSYKSLSGRLTPRSSPSYRRNQSLLNKASPVREKSSFTSSSSSSSSSSSVRSSWYRKISLRRALPWLILFVGVWSYIGFHAQSRASPIRERSAFTSSFSSSSARSSWYWKISLRWALPWLILFVGVWSYIGFYVQFRGFKKRNTDRFGEEGDYMIRLLRAEQRVVGNKAIVGTKQARNQGLPKQAKDENDEPWYFPAVGFVNTSMGRFVGPFEEAEKEAFGLTQKSKSRCSGDLFGGFVHRKSFLLVLHELSMTGSPLVMMELGSEILSCGGRVQVVALSRKGGLLQELRNRGISVLPSKGTASFRAAAKVDMLVAGSALCASWIQQYVAVSKRRSKPLAWWIMENRHEYFDRSKNMLGKANVLIFLSESQLQRWRVWSKTEGFAFPARVEVVPLSVNEDLSTKAGLEGLKAGLEEDSEVVEDRHRRALRDNVREKIGLNPLDVLIVSLSSINPGKGQLLFLEAVSLALKEEDEDRESSNARHLKILIGSVGSKSNKVVYIQNMLNLISTSYGLADATFWSPATVHVAPLYLAADAYIMNSQGIGETFGRVTIEAMAFGLPVLGTDAGGTREIVEENVTGLLHPLGRQGVPILARHIRYLLRNLTMREQMGLKGKERARNLYMKGTMYQELARVFRSSTSQHSIAMA